MHVQVSWSSVLGLCIHAQVTGPVDTSNFDSYPVEETGEPLDDLTGWDKDF